MEPFDLTFHQVTSDDSLSDSNFDSFSNVVNYETSFDNSGQSLPLSVYNVNTVQYTWKDYTYTTTTAIQTTNGGIPTGNSTTAIHHQSVWSNSLQGSPPHRSFLVHPDDSLGDAYGLAIGSKAAAVTKQELNVLAQISSNTTAAKRQGKRTQRFVARTVTSPSTPIPQSPFMMSEYSEGQPQPGQANVAVTGQAGDDGNEQGAEDNSFETVAEALRLQWSVIGNKTLEPVSADVVAQIVAQAEKKMKAGDSSPLPVTHTPATSPTDFTMDVERTVASPSLDPPLVKPEPTMFHESHRDDCPRELKRILPTEITTETTGGSSWFSSGANSNNTNGKNSSKQNMDRNLTRTNGKNSPKHLGLSSAKSSAKHSLASSEVKAPSPVPSDLKPPITIPKTDTFQHPAKESPLSPEGFALPPHGFNPSYVSSPMNLTDKPQTPSATEGQGHSGTTTSPTSVPGKTEISDSFSEASYSSEMELDKYLQGPLTAAGFSTNYQLESEAFLKSLPPIKPINLEVYATVPLLPIKTHEKKQRSVAASALSDSSHKSKSKPGSGHKTHKKKGRNSDVVNTNSSHDHSRPVNDLSDSFPGSPPSSFNSPSGYNSSAFSTPKTSIDSENSDNSGDQSKLFHSAMSNEKILPGGSFSKKQLDEILKEKAKLQGQLEILTEESQSMLQERAELQAQLATLKAQMATMQAAEGGSGNSEELKREVENLRASWQPLEQSVLDANRLLSEKSEEIRGLADKLQIAQDTSNKLQVRTQEMRDEIRAKDMNVQALKNKIAELYVEVQTSIQAKMEADTEARTSRNDLMSLVKAKEWYQEQLQVAHDVRARLQRELTILQGQAVSHGTIVEKLKTESTRLRQQLTETQQRAFRDKELLARHLEGIQSDMMEREAAFLEIQRERKLYEDTFNYQVTTAEEEKSRLSMLQQATDDLEAQLDRAHSEAKKRHQELLSMETGQVDVMKRLAVTEETLSEKEKALGEMDQKLIQMESQLKAVMSDLSKKDGEILTLKEEKASTEIALKSALQEKASVDKALEVLKADMGKVEVSFKQMKQELNVRICELEQVKVEKDKLREELDRSQHELEIKVLSVNAMTRTFDGQSAAQQDLEAEKAKLVEEMEGLKLKVQNVEYELNQKDQALMEATDKVNNLTMKISGLEAKLEEAKDSVPADKIKIYESEIDSLRLRIQALEEVEAEEASGVEKEREMMQEEIRRLKEELLERQKAYEENLDILDKKLKEMTIKEQQLETELGIRCQSEELSQLEERDSYREEIQSLTMELQSERQEKIELEQQLLSLQATKTAEVESLQEKLKAVTEALESLREKEASMAEVDSINQTLGLELEQERGRVMGLRQTNTELKEHSYQLEAALAHRESALDDLKRSVEESTRDLEQRDEKFLTRISGLEAAVAKEVEVQRDLRKQMGSKLMENNRLKKQNEGAKMELEQLKKDLAASQQTASQAMSDLEVANSQSQSHLSEAKENAAYSKSLEAELERVRRDLNDNLARQPVLLEQTQSLEWQCSQKTKEVEAAQQQIQMAEERAQEEIEAVKASLQEKQSEIDSLQAELSVLRQDKTHQRSQVNELRGALKASVQHHKLTKRLNENENGTNDKSVQANMEKKLVIPPLPFDLSAVEQLIQDTKVTPLDSKPLDQLSSCLSSLRAEISGLQKQMDLHTSAVHSSNKSWRTVQHEVDDLNEVMRTIANTVIAANSHYGTITMATAVDREQADILHV